MIIKWTKLKHYKSIPNKCVKIAINQLNAFLNQSLNQNGLEGSRYWQEWTHSSRPDMQLAGPKNALYQWCQTQIFLATCYNNLLLVTCHYSKLLLFFFLINFFLPLPWLSSPLNLVESILYTLYIHLSLPHTFIFSSSLHHHFAASPLLFLLVSSLYSFCSLFLCVFYRFGSCGFSGVVDFGCEFLGIGGYGGGDWFWL